MQLLACWDLASQFVKEVFKEDDVVVVNFLNRRNAADQRVFQLLSQKSRLFDGIFGSSDEVLGALEASVDLEKPIAQVYQECRTPTEIEAAFDQFQAELDETIGTRLAETRRLVTTIFFSEGPDPVFDCVPSVCARALSPGAILASIKKAFPPTAST